MTRHRSMLGFSPVAALGVLVALMAGGSGCTRSEQTAETTPAPADPEVMNQPGPVTEEGPFAMRRTGEAQPRVRVQNDYPVTQHVFIDGDHVGTVPTGEIRTFDISVGQHTIVCADSTDIADNPVSSSRVFEEGYEYLLQVYTGSAPPRRW